MNVLMTVFGQKACRDYLLPDRSNCHHSILLEAAFYGFHEDIELTLINREGHWSPDHGSDLSVKTQMREQEGSLAGFLLRSGGREGERSSSYMVCTAFGEQVEIFFYPVRQPLRQPDSFSVR